MKVLIIGNSSFISKYLFEHLHRKFIIKTAGRNHDADFYLELNSFIDEINISENFDIIIHCAGSFKNNQVVNAIQNELVNSIGALKVAMTAEKVKCKHLIYLSTISIYNVPENDCFGSYGLSKKHGQENLEFICKELNIKFTALILSQIYDKHGEARKHQNLFYHIIDCARDNKAVIFWGKKDPMRNLLFIDDVLTVIEQVIEQQVYGIYPCVHPKSYSLSTIAKIAFDIFGNKAKITFSHDNQDIPSIYIPNSLDIYKIINYTCKVDLPQGISLIKDCTFQFPEGE